MGNNKKIVKHSAHEVLQATHISHNVYNVKLFNTALCRPQGKHIQQNTLTLQTTINDLYGESPSYNNIIRTVNFTYE